MSFQKFVCFITIVSFIGIKLFSIVPYYVYNVCRICTEALSFLIFLSFFLSLVGGLFFVCLFVCFKEPAFDCFFCCVLKFLLFSALYYSLPLVTLGFTLLFFFLPHCEPCEILVP